MRDDRPERRTSDYWAALWAVIFTATLAAHLIFFLVIRLWWIAGAPASRGMP